jgi:hypothetical protein
MTPDPEHCKTLLLSLKFIAVPVPPYLVYIALSVGASKEAVPLKSSVPHAERQLDQCEGKQEDPVSHPL